MLGRSDKVHLPSDTAGIKVFLVHSWCPTVGKVILFFFLPLLT